MKKVATIILLLGLFTSCNLPDDKTENDNFEKSSIEQEIKNIPENKLSVIVIDDCEYIIYKEDKDANSSYGFMAHKGNCSNPIHQCK
jgi:hypothetical protein